MGLDFWNWDWGGAMHTNNNKLGGAAAGAATGAAVGSVVPVIGTGIGAVAGGLLGLLAGGSADAAENQADAQHDQLTKQQQAYAQQANPYANQRNPYVGLSNPYADGNAGLLALLGLQQGTTMRSFADAERSTQEMMARMGMAGTAQEASALRRLTTDRARALSAGESDLRAQSYQQAANWDTANRQNAANYGLAMLQNGANWDQNHQRTIMGDLAGNRDRYQAQADQTMQNFGNLAGTAMQFAGGGGFGGVGGGGLKSLAARQAPQQSQPVQFGNGYYGPLAPRNQDGSLYDTRSASSAPAKSTPSLESLGRFNPGYRRGIYE